MRIFKSGKSPDSRAGGVFILSTSWRHYAEPPVLGANSVGSEKTSQWESALLDWAAANPNQFFDIEEREFDLPSGKFYSFGLIARSTSQNRIFAGLGRDRIRRRAASKAVGEGIERIVGAEAFADPFMCAMHGITVSSNGQASIFELPAPEPMPSPGLRSSNGWAIHFTQEAALAGALSEALERHILL